MIVRIIRMKILYPLYRAYAWLYSRLVVDRRWRH